MQKSPLFINQEIRLPQMTTHLYRFLQSYLKCLKQLSKQRYHNVEENALLSENQFGFRFLLMFHKVFKTKFFFNKIATNVDQQGENKKLEFKVVFSLPWSWPMVVNQNYHMHCSYNRFVRAQLSTLLLWYTGGRHEFVCKVMQILLKKRLSILVSLECTKYETQVECKIEKIKRLAYQFLLWI